MFPLFDGAAGIGLLVTGGSMAFFVIWNCVADMWALGARGHDAATLQLIATTKADEFVRRYVARCSADVQRRWRKTIHATVLDSLAAAQPQRRR
jgi:hypothetical protein